MEFGKLNDLSEVDFSLPPEPPRNAALLDRLPPMEKAPTVYVGCTGWSMKEWVGKVYPPGTKSADYLRQYARQFNTIELNTTHYRIPDLRTIRKWYEESADDFRFCPKIPQSISHSRDLGGGQLTEFCLSIEGLEEKLGCCFLQLPPYFGPDRLPVLEHFLGRFPRELPLAVELRHPGWFAGPDGEEVWAALERHGAAAVITDVAGRRDVAHMQLTAPRTLVRFVGNGLHPTDYRRIDEWVQRLAGWTGRGLPEVFFFTHEPDNLLAPDLSLYLVAQVRKNTTAETRGPEFHRDPGADQLKLF